MYDASNNGPDWIGMVDMPRFFDFEQGIKRRFNTNTNTNTNTNVPTKQEDIHLDNDETDCNESTDSFFSTTIETIQFLIKEFTKVFEAYAGLD